MTFLQSGKTMAHHNKYDLLEQIVKAVTDSGWNILYLGSIDEHPFRLQIYREETSYRVKIYIWHLTHGGGRKRPEHEYRIQITGTDHFELSPAEKTLVLGWWKETEVFAGFDVRKHLGKLGQSPSIQIREESLHDAYVNGFSPCDKGNNEVAIAFRPDFFVEYIRNLEALHDFGQFAEDLAVLSEVAQNPEINDADIQIKDNARKTTVVSVSRTLRDVGFRKRVLTAYAFRCAVCGIQLKLVEAAHIIPVNHENSTDETRNGLALCVLHHKAFDQALIAVGDDYSVLLNQNKVTELKHLKLAEGLPNFTQNLRPVILLPPAITDRPHIEYLRIANRIRGL
jgi:putative restriction endonuclease